MKARILPSTRLTSGITSCAIHQHRGVGAVAQGSVQYRPVFSDVDLLDR